VHRFDSIKKKKAVDLSRRQKNRELDIVGNS